MSGGSRNIAISVAGFAALVTAVLSLLFASGGEATAQAPAPTQAGGAGNFLGVASCAGSTCHGRSVANRPEDGVVRQDEILIWQDPASAAGAHSRAFAVLQEQRSRQIAQRLGVIGEASSAPECLGCHATPVDLPNRGARFLTSDGVSCEACHGAASPWISYHASAGATHAGNLSRGMNALEDPKVRAGVCLDCHFGNEQKNRFVTHRLMAAGHPRISFELDLFSTLQAHHDEDADYINPAGQGGRGKLKVTNVQMWAVGQAMALERSLHLFTETDRGWEGLFPEFYFLDCHSCHRPIYDKPVFEPTTEVNRGRGALPPGMPPYNDENMIMLSAAARVVAPDVGRRFDSASREFHESMSGTPAGMGNRARMRTAAQRLRTVAGQLADRFAQSPIENAQVFRIIDTITSQAISERFTNYAGSVQAVMATDTLLSALVANGGISSEAVQGIRADINGAYQAVREPNSYLPRDFRASLGRAAAAIRRLR